MTEKESQKKQSGRIFSMLRGDQQDQSGPSRTKQFFYEEGNVDNPKKGFYLLPNLLTSAGLLCGFWAMTEAFVGDFVAAAILLLVAMAFDGVDGKVARLTHTSSTFGVQFDSLADLVSFGVAPALLVFTWALKYSLEPKVGWTIAAMYVICAAFRLARFNVHFDPEEKTFMTGLAAPPAASGIALSILFFDKVGLTTAEGLSSLPNLMLVLTATLSFLMISKVKYYSFKDIDIIRKRPLYILLVVIMSVLIIRVWPFQTLYFLFFVYMLSGPALFLFRWYFKAPGETGESIID